MWKQEVNSEFSVLVHFTESEKRLIEFARTGGYDGFHPVSLEGLIRHCVEKEISRIRTTCGEAIKFQWDRVFLGEDLPQSREDWEKVNPDFFKKPKDYLFSKPIPPFHKPGPYNN